MRFIILTALLMTIATFKSSAETCAYCGSAANQTTVSATDGWLLNINRRYNKSNRLFTGTADQQESIAMGVYIRNTTALKNV